MTRFCQYVLSLAFLYLSSVLPATAMPDEALVQQLNAQVVRVQVQLAGGSYGLGSGVVIAKEQIVTNCHVVANASSVSVVSGGVTYVASALKPDWRHDVCILKVEGLIAPIATIGASKTLKYEQSVFTVGYPGFLPVPTSTYGFVKGLFPMDGSVVVRSTSSFNLGASGGGVFDDDGKLVGIITLKSPGKNSYYYNMPVEWVQALLLQPEQAITSKSELPFWAESAEKWPFFMKVVQPYLTQDWQALRTIAADWSTHEPESTEAWFYLASAEYGTKDTQLAETHFKKVVAANHEHSQAIYYLGLIAEETGKHSEALSSVALLNGLDEITAGELKLAMGISEKP